MNNELFGFKWFANVFTGSVLCVLVSFSFMVFNANSYNQALAEAYARLHPEGAIEVKLSKPKLNGKIQSSPRKVHQRFLKSEQEMCVLINPEDTPSDVNDILNRYYADGAFTHYVQQYDDGQISVCFLSQYDH